MLLSNNELSVADAEGLVNALLVNRIDENVELVQAYTRMYNLVKDVEYTGVNSDFVERKMLKKHLFEAASKSI